jgi:hypothetical protein
MEAKRGETRGKLNKASNKMERSLRNGLIEPEFAQRCKLLAGIQTEVSLQTTSRNLLK